jgi:hypothetical protein
MQDALIGTALAQYELRERLGYGGLATVYRGFQPSLGREVAVKVLPLDRVADPTLPERFRREARLAASLMHPNIVPVYDFGEWDDYLCIVMALVSGGTLKQRMTSPVPLDTGVRLIGQIADALGYAHARGIFHRDVKPGNVLLASPDWAMLGDFGIARALGESTPLTNPYGTLGTPIYMAPEQWLGEEIDGRADLYALGAVLYEMLAGQPPFPGTTIAALMGQHLEAPIPLLPAHGSVATAPFDEVLQTALAKRPEHRYPDAAAFKAALDAAARGQPRLDATIRVPTGVNVGWSLAGSVTAQERSRVWGAPPESPHSGYRAHHDDEARSIMPVLLALVLACVVLVAGGAGYLLAGGQLSGGDAASEEPTPTLVAQLPLAAASAPTPPPAQVTLPTPFAPPTATAASPTPAPTSAPPMATVPAAAAVPTPPPPAAAPAPAAPSDPRIAVVESHVADYFAALNKQDYAAAQAACCTPRWRSQYPLDAWQRNFDGVTDLRFATPFRYTTVEPDRIVTEIDYSFRSGGAQRFFTLRWTFVPVGQDWLADDAQAFAQQR